MAKDLATVQAQLARVRTLIATIEADGMASLGGSEGKQLTRVDLRSLYQREQDLEAQEAALEQIAGSGASAGVRFRGVVA